MLLFFVADKVNEFTARYHQHKLTCATIYSDSIKTVIHLLEKLHVANIVVKIAPYKQTKKNVTDHSVTVDYSVMFP